MDYTNLQADRNCILNDARGYSHMEGRDGVNIRHIVLHHNAGVRQSGETVARFWERSGTSAHYQVEDDGTVVQIVHDWDTAFHAGDWNENLCSIGIEHANISGAPDWEISEETIRSGGKLTGALCYGYNLGYPVWGQNVFPHSNFTATFCPGQIRDEYRDRYMQYAQEMYRELSGDETHESSGSNDSIKERLCEALHANGVDELPQRADALIAASSYGGVNFPYGVEFTQSTVGTYVDGIWGPDSRDAHDDTTGKVQSILGVEVDFIVGPITEAALKAAIA